MKIKSLIFALCAMFAVSNASAFDWTTLKGLNVGNVVNSLISTDKIEIADLTGTWASEGPAVTFKSENLLQKAGGVAAEGTIEDKLAKYYSKMGLDNFTITFDGTENFVMTLANGRTVQGTISKGTKDGTLTFNFSTLGTSKLSKVTAYVSKGTQLRITFDVSKLSTIISKVAQYSGNSTFTSISSLLSSYKGIYCGFKLNPAK